VVHEINIYLFNEIGWLFSKGVVETTINFQTLSGLPIVIGAIDSTHFEIAKPCFGSTDYFYFKSVGYSLNCQAIVDSQKRFLDFYTGMPGLTNDRRMLKRFNLFHQGQRGAL